MISFKLLTVDNERFIFEVVANENNFINFVDKREFPGENCLPVPEFAGRFGLLMAIVVIFGF